MIFLRLSEFLSQHSQYIPLDTQPRISGGRNPGGNAPITQPGTVASFPNPALSIPRTGDAPQMGLGAGLAVLALLGLAMYFGRRASAD